ncbi:MULTISPECIES: hypothetical protein [Methanosarcina]|nr:MULTISPECIES: hypothetical protein [Methanosarcina]
MVGSPTRECTATAINSSSSDPASSDIKEVILSPPRDPENS